jgi:hypothetical protein
MLKGKEGCIEVQTKLYGRDLKNLLRNENSIVKKEYFRKQQDREKEVKHKN